MVGMFPFLRAEDKHIHPEIRTLNEVEAHVAIPKRLGDVAWLKEVEPLEMDPSATGSSDELEVMISEEEAVCDDEYDSGDEEDGGRRKKRKGGEGCAGMGCFER